MSLSLGQKGVTELLWWCRVLQVATGWCGLGGALSQRSLTWICVVPLGMFQGNQQRLQEGEGGAWSAGGSPEGGSCAGFIPTPSACPHKAQKHKRCPPGLPARALGRSQGARGRLLALCPFGTCCPFPSECPVPSPACLLPNSLRAVAEVLHREHLGLLPTACHTEEQFLGLL